MEIGTFEFESALWLWSATDAWHFVTVPPDISEEIRELTAGLRQGFGSVRVAVTVGDTSWRTSVFPDTTSGCFMLPMKKAVRAAEHLDVGDTARVRLTLADL